MTAAVGVSTEPWELQPEAYHLYRLFRFGVSPRLYMLRGALTETCRLEPSQYSARVGR